MHAQTPGTLQTILDGGVIAILRASESSGLLDAARAIAAGGITALEFTLNTPDALALIGEARAELDGKTMVGAGTVLTVQQARAALAAGAQFIVTPVLSQVVIETAHAAGVPIIPGAYTPTEINTAWEWGADLVKLFPASAGGLEYFKAIRAPLGHIGIVPTGGVNLANAKDFILAGASALALGGNMADPAAIAAGEFHRLTETSARFLEIVKNARSKKVK